jgi:cytoskeleton protein RodZ
MASELRPEAAGGRTAAMAIGDSLREARMREHLDIADVEAKTKIRAKYLRALENEEFGMLPGHTFVKTFLRTYAEALGLDPQALVEEYRSTYESREEAEQVQPLSPTAVARDRRRGRGPGPTPGRSWLLTGIAALSVVGVLLVIGLVGGDDSGGSKKGDGSKELGAQTTTTQQKQKKEKPKQGAAAQTVTVKITPNNQVYACIDKGAGTAIVFNGILDAPRTFKDGKLLRVNLGKTDLQLTVNGKQVPIQPGPEPVGYAFTPTSTKSLPLGQRPCA